MKVTDARTGKEVTRPDFVIKDIPREERANLPTEMKILLYLHMKQTTVDAWMVEDCRRKFPQYFEKDTKIFRLNEL